HMARRPPRSLRCPYTTLFRSHEGVEHRPGALGRRCRELPRGEDPAEVLNRLRARQAPGTGFAKPPQGSSVSVSSAAACTACGEYGQGRLTFEAQSFV